MVGVAAIVLLGACSGSKSKPDANRHFNPLSSTTTSTVDPHALHVPADFQLPDTRFVSLLPVSGRPLPSPPIPVTGGHATVSGVVTGPAGPVGGATVRIERWVGTASGSINVSTDGGGRFAAGNLLGGHYKVRAWLQPSLTTFKAATGFVADNGRLTANVSMEQHDAYVVQLAARTGAITVGQPFAVVTLVTQETVDPNGIVLPVPVPNNSVSLSVDGGMVIAGANPATTDAGGTATWTLTCQAPGGYSATVSSPNGSRSLALPACTAPTTTVPPPTVLPLPIGQSFTVPAAGPYPAGTYKSSGPACTTTFEIYVNGNWQPGEGAGPSLSLAGPGRSFQAVAGSPPGCTYTRQS